MTAFVKIFVNAISVSYIHIKTLYHIISCQHTNLNDHLCWYMYLGNNLFD